MQAYRLVVYASVFFAFACGGGSCSSCGGFTSQPFGTYQGDKFDSAGALRISKSGFGVINTNSSAILEIFAPGKVITSTVDCQTNNVGAGIDIAVGDTGTAGCTNDSCGYNDGKCDARDVGATVTVTVNTLTLNSKSPDVLEATINASVKTGPLPFSETKSSILCLFSGRMRCTVDLDTARKDPPANDLSIQIHLLIDPKWDKLVSISVGDIGGAKACGSSGASSPPACLDPKDITIENADESCGACTTLNISIIKSLLVDKLASSLAKQISKSLTKASCAKCGPNGECPKTAQATSTCDMGSDQCIDSSTGKCAPALLGTEGELAVGRALASVGAPAAAAIGLSLGLGGSVVASDTGLTIGMRGGAKELVVASCVKPVTRPLPPALPLPNFDGEAPGAYDLGLSLSAQFVSEMLLRAQQSGALCLELSTETVAAFESTALSAFLPSLNTLTRGADVPMRLVIRPVNAPTATIGAGTFDASGHIADPLIRLNWPGVEFDLYAFIEDRDVRLFTMKADLTLPIGLTGDGCSSLQPVVGDLMQAVTNIEVKNSELLAEPLEVQAKLVPSLLSLAEPQLSKGLSKVTLPSTQGFDLHIVGTKGLGQISGTNTYNHLGVFASLVPTGTVCTPKMLRHAPIAPRLLGHEGPEATIEWAGGPVSWRVDEGFWSPLQLPELSGQLTVRHPRLNWPFGHVIELRRADGSTSRVSW